MQFGGLISALRPLLVINYCMDEDDPLLSHQVQTVNSLSQKFEIVYVVTGRVGKFSSPSNVHVFSSDWRTGERVRNIIKFLFVVFPIVTKKNPVSVFSHMTEVQTSLIAPLTKFLRIRHYLWYAHAHKSVYLNWARFWVTGIITSTKGSCPIQGPKVFVIGQAIDSEVYRFSPRESNDFNKLVHIGRFDPSKNIEHIIRSTKEFRKCNPYVSLTLIGEPSTLFAKKEAQKILDKYHTEISEGWLNFKGSIPRSNIHTELLKYDCFVHAYSGSLDKTLIEATMVGLPIATINPEYLTEFGNWSRTSPVSLLGELNALKKAKSKQLALELLNRRAISKTMHSLEHWSKVLSDILS